MEESPAEYATPFFHRNTRLRSTHSWPRLYALDQSEREILVEIFAETAQRERERERERVLEGVGTRRRMRRCACFDLFDRNEYTADIYAMRVKVSHRIFLLLREKKKMIIDYHLSP